MQDFDCSLGSKNFGLWGVVVDFTCRYASCDLLVEEFALALGAAFATFELSDKVIEKAKEPRLFLG